MEVVRQLKKLAAGSAVLALAAFAGVSVAQADKYVAPGRVVTVAPTSWSGLYFGAHSGYSWSSIDTTYQAGGGVFSNSWDHDVPIVGGQIGLQHQFGLLVVGVEGGMSSTFNNRDAVQVCPNPVVNCHARFNDVLTVGARLGYAMGKWMPYATGGYASGSFQRETVDPATGTIFDRDHSRHSGWYVGGGVDMALAGGWTVGLEYRHYEFDEAFHLAFNSAGAPIAGSHNFMDPSTDTVTLRVSWKLGRPEAAPLK